MPYDTFFDQRKAKQIAALLNLRDERDALPLRIADLEDALRPFLLKIDIQAVLRLPPKTKISPKLLTAGDYQAAAKAIQLDELLPTAQQEQSSS
jgi:hypothetical protein